MELMICYHNDSLMLFMELFGSKMVVNEQKLTFFH